MQSASAESPAAAAATRAESRRRLSRDAPADLIWSICTINAACSLQAFGCSPVVYSMISSLFAVLCCSPCLACPIRKTLAWRRSCRSCCNLFHASYWGITCNIHVFSDASKKKRIWSGECLGKLRQKAMGIKGYIGAKRKGENSQGAAVHTAKSMQGQGQR